MTETATMIKAQSAEGLRERCTPRFEKYMNQTRPGGFGGELIELSNANEISGSGLRASAVHARLRKTTRLRQLELRAKGLMSIQLFGEPFVRLILREV